KLPDARRLDERVVCTNLCRHPLEYRVQVYIFDIHHHAFRVTQRELLIFQLTI
ncbi:hypothetical protein EC940618_3776, partial [Escherichia coli 94.0618]